jgi:glucose-6-phosphate isomerase
MLAAFADLLYTQTRGITTRAVFAYDERLRLLPSYLQQLEMESNGKSVTADGAPLGRPSAAITWGGVGTDAQHAVFQLLHQGSHIVPVEFVASIEPGDTLDPEHHRLLLVNAFAQGAALMTGRASDDGNRAYPGDRPSTTILLDRLDAQLLGHLALCCVEVVLTRRHHPACGDVPLAGPHVLGVRPTMHQQAPVGGEHGDGDRPVLQPVATHLGTGDRAHHHVVVVD